tara:strand:+ start:166 stop:330 length:165 start_codon:yes stop_codon:yes gene_type:complete
MNRSSTLFNEAKNYIPGGVYFAPSAYECGFLSAAHGKHELDQTINAALTAFSEL